MRYLRLFRERALFAFGTSYYCVMQHTKENLIDEAMQIGFPDILHAEGYSDYPVRNGERVAIEVPETDFTFVIAAFRESIPLVTETIQVPAGDENVTYVIKTDYNGQNRIGLRVEPM